MYYSKKLSNVTNRNKSGKILPLEKKRIQFLEVELAFFYIYKERGNAHHKVRAKNRAHDSAGNVIRAKHVFTNKFNADPQKPENRTYRKGLQDQRVILDKHKNACRNRSHHHNYNRQKMYSDGHGMIIPNMHQEIKPVYQEDNGAEPKQAQIHAAPFRSLHASYKQRSDIDRHKNVYKVAGKPLQQELDSRRILKAQIHTREVYTANNTHYYHDCGKDFQEFRALFCEHDYPHENNGDTCENHRSNIRKGLALFKPHHSNLQQEPHESIQLVHGNQDAEDSKQGMVHHKP